MTIRARAPVRISLGGGGTDIEPYVSKYGGLVLSSTINLFAYCTVSRYDKFLFESLDIGLRELYTGISSLTYDGFLNFPKSVVKFFSRSNEPISVSIFSEIKPGSGLGGSSALMVAIIKAVSEYYGKNLLKHEIAELAYKLEREELSLKGGYQDQFASAYGGFNIIEFSANGTKVIPLRIEDDIIRELLASLILVDIGKGRLSSNIISRQITSYENASDEILESLKQMKNITREMVVRILAGDIKELGTLLSEEWNLKKSLDKKISNETVDDLHAGMIEHGAIGGKLLGAGEGGHMLFLSDLSKRKELLRFVESLGLRNVPFSFENEGVQAWKV